MSREQRAKSKDRQSTQCFCSLMDGVPLRESEGWDEALEHDLLMQAMRDHDYPPEYEIGVMRDD